MAIAALIVSVPPLTMGADWETWLYRGLALLLIACPCALVLSTQAAIASGLAVATRRGLLINGGNALENIGRVSRSEEHTSELQTNAQLVCRLLLEKKKAVRGAETRKNTRIK